MTLSPFIGTALLVTAAGCSQAETNTPDLRAFADAGCPGSTNKDVELTDLVILDWTGGVNRIYPDRHLMGVDLGAFPMDNGECLAEHEGQFKEDVLAQISRIYCDRGDIDLHVINGEDQMADSMVTVVHITQDLSPKGGNDVGKGEYDPCNLVGGNAAILFGERLLALSGDYAYDEWVNVFANICAHEIGHTLGFGHVSRKDYRYDAKTRYIELMLGGHTMAELRHQHRFVVIVPNCPTEDDGAVNNVIASEVTH